MGHGVGDLVVEAVAGQGRVVRLDIHLVLVLEPVADEEAVDGGRVVVVLVLGRFHRLGLDQERALEADLVLVLGHEMQESGELPALPAEVGVEQGLVALATAPQRVVRAAEPLGHAHHVLDLGGGVGEDLGIRVRRGSCRIARVAEQVRGPPQQPNAGAFLVGRRLVDDRVQVGRRLGERRTFRGHVAIVEAVVGDARASRGIRTRPSAWPARRPSDPPRRIHGRSNVPRPNMSVPPQANECHRQTPIRRCSSIRLPRTRRSASYTLKAKRILRSPGHRTGPAPSPPRRTSSLKPNLLPSSGRPRDERDAVFGRAYHRWFV